MRHLGIIVCFVFALGALAHAEIYKWVDRNGTTHFADTLNRVPEEYRSQVQAKTSLTPPARSVTSPASLEATPQDSEERRLQPIEPTSYVVPLQRVGHNLMVGAVFNGVVSSPLLVDTGASYTVISTLVARQLALNLADAAVIPMRSASGTFLAPLTKVRTLAVGEAMLRDQEVIVHDVAPGLGGLLGMSFLEHFVVTTTDQSLILAPPVETPGTVTYGGYAQDWWVRKFRFYRQNVERTKEYLAQHASPQLQKTLQYFQAELNALERKASAAAVPRQWRY